MHGRLLAGLAAWAIDRDHGDPAFVPARLTVDMFKSPAMKETRVSTILVRAGGRVRVADALIQVGGVDVARRLGALPPKGRRPGRRCASHARVGLDRARCGRARVRGAVRGTPDRRNGIRRARAPTRVAAGASASGHRRGAHTLHSGRGRLRHREPARELGVRGPRVHQRGCRALPRAGCRRASGLASSTPIGWRPTAYRSRTAGCTTSTGRSARARSARC